MFKPETVDDTLRRIARAEVGLDIEPNKKVLLGQYVGKFRTEHSRQDLSTGYYVPVDDSQSITLNRDHFTAYQLVDHVPPRTGAMYRFYLERYFAYRDNGFPRNQIRA